MKRRQAIFEKKFRITVLKMIQIAGKQWRRCKKCFQRPTWTKEQTEMNNTLKGINNSITKAEEWTNDLEDRIVEINSAEQKFFFFK